MKPGIRITTSTLYEIRDSIRKSYQSFSFGWQSSRNTIDSKPATYIHLALQHGFDSHIFTLCDRYLPRNTLYDFSSSLCLHPCGQPNMTVLWVRPPTPEPWILQYTTTVHITDTYQSWMPPLTKQCINISSRVLVGAFQVNLYGKEKVQVTSLRRTLASSF